MERPNFSYLLFHYCKVKISPEKSHIISRDINFLHSLAPLHYHVLLQHPLAHVSCAQ